MNEWKNSFCIGFITLQQGALIWENYKSRNNAVLPKINFQIKHDCASLPANLGQPLQPPNVKTFKIFGSFHFYNSVLCLLLSVLRRFLLGGFLFFCDPVGSRRGCTASGRIPALRHLENRQARQAHLTYWFTSQLLSFRQTYVWNLFDFNVISFKLDAIDCLSISVKQKTQKCPSVFSPKYCPFYIFLRTLQTKRFCTKMVLHCCHFEHRFPTLKYKCSNAQRGCAQKSSTNLHPSMPSCCDGCDLRFLEFPSLGYPPSPPNLFHWMNKNVSLLSFIVFAVIKHSIRRRTSHNE